MIMTYSIAEVAKKFGLSIHTLRYYDKEGLMPYVDRNASGTRVFKDSDFDWLAIINCLKHSGVPIKKIRDFVNWCIEGDCTIEKRLQFLQSHKREVEQQIQELQKHTELLDYKIWYYETAKEAGTTAIHTMNKEQEVDKLIS